MGYGVKWNTLRDGRVTLEGSLLYKTEPMLLNIFCFTPSAPLLGTMSTTAHATSSNAPSWVSGWPLDAEERTFLENVLYHRLPAIAAGQDQLAPIPDCRSLTRKLIHTILYY